MRILFSMRHLGSLRMYDSVLRRLATARPSRRHPRAPQGRARHERRARDAAGRTCRTSAGSGRKSKSAPGPRSRRRSGSGWTTCDSARRSTASRRARAAHVGERVPALLRRVSAWPLVRSEAGRRTLVACLRLVERVLPRQPGLDALVRELQPGRRAADAGPAAGVVPGGGAAQRACVRRAHGHLRRQLGPFVQQGPDRRRCRTRSSSGTIRSRPKPSTLHARARVPRGGDWRAVLRPVVRPRAGPVARSLLRQAGPAGRPPVPAVCVLGALAGSADRSPFHPAMDRIAAGQRRPRAADRRGAGAPPSPASGRVARGGSVASVRRHRLRIASARHAVEGGLLRLAVSLRRPSSGC